MIVLDASVLIAHLDAQDAHHEAATALLLRAGDEGLAASPLTIAEVLVGPTRAGTDHSVRIALHDLGVHAVPLGDGSPAELASLRVTTGLRLPDCCVLLAALTVSAAVATFDTRLGVAVAQLGLRSAS